MPSRSTGSVTWRSIGSKRSGRATPRNWSPCVFRGRKESGVSVPATCSWSSGGTPSTRCAPRSCGIPEPAFQRRLPAARHQIPVELELDVAVPGGGRHHHEADPEGGAGGDELLAPREVRRLAAGPGVQPEVEGAGAVVVDQQLDEGALAPLARGPGAAEAAALRSGLVDDALALELDGAGLGEEVRRGVLDVGGAAQRLFRLLGPLRLGQPALGGDRTLVGRLAEARQVLSRVLQGDGADAGADQDRRVV